jgi:UDP-N-acetylglucosamine 2-epimerase (non-hydrolysing)
MPERKLKILTIFGTRKELIRLYPVIERFRVADDIESILVTTSQHQEPLEDLFALFNIAPDHDLNLKRNKKSLSDITTLALSGIEPTLKLHKPDIVLVQGESTTAFAGAMAAFYYQIPVGHIGAGERTFIKTDPYPQEINRRLVSTLSDLHFVFNAGNTEYLIHEGAIPRNIFVTGNTIIDAVLDIAHRKPNTLCRHISPDDLKAFRLILVTCLKKENRGEPLHNLCQGLLDLTQAYPDIQVAFPMQYESNIREVVLKNLFNNERIHLLDPIPYDTYVEAIVQCHLIITDSDCIMEEGRALKKPVMLFKEAAETDGKSADKGVLLTGLTRENLVIETSRLLEDTIAYRNMIGESQPNGDGHASERIIQAIRYYFDSAERPDDYKPRWSGQQGDQENAHGVIEGQFGAAKDGKRKAAHKSR